MAIKLPQATRQAACDAIVDLCDTGGAGTIVIYDGTVPDPDSAVTGTLLATLTLSNPAFGSADANGDAAANTITDDSSADASGTATYFRFLAGDASHAFQGTVGLTGSGEDLELTSNPVATEPVSISSFTFSVPQDQT